MSNMDLYKKKYKEAMDRMELCVRSGLKITPEYIFPELAESEDEKMREELIRSFKSLNTIEIWNGIKRSDILAWLEKQEGCEYIKKDWLEHIKQSWYKEGLIDGKYSGGTSKEWTINDAATLKELIDFLENGTAKLQHDLTRYANWLKNQFTPIERQGEQKFEMKTAEESLGIDSDTYNKIVDECIFGEQKTEENKGNIEGISPNWSEEDKGIIEEVVSYLINYSNIVESKEDADRIEYLIDKIQDICPHQKQEWSEEDEQHIDSLLKRLDALCRNKFERTRFAISEDRDWLKSLRPQNTWKPSDEQMKLLSEVQSALLGKDCHNRFTGFMWELKKLKDK